MTWLPPVPKIPGGLKGLSPASPQHAWGAERTESRQSIGYLGGLKGPSPATPEYLGA